MGTWEIPPVAPFEYASMLNCISRVLLFLETSYNDRFGISLPNSVLKSLGWELSEKIKFEIYPILTRRLEYYFPVVESIKIRSNFLFRPVEGAQRISIITVCKRNE